MKKGFTLIELLAIIALIAAPVILNIIDDTNKSSVEISMDNLDQVVDLYCQRKQLNGTLEKIIFICRMVNVQVDQRLWRYKATEYKAE